jgi:polyisoprenoid-binding protein YceI
MKTILSACFLFCFMAYASAQTRYYTKNAVISFHSKAPVENIDASTNTGACVLDIATGKIQFAVNMRGFEFRKALMQEHFNESYVESDKFPKAEFRGTITNISQINFNQVGSYPAEAEGSLTLHGQTRQVKAKGTIKIGEAAIDLDSKFSILLSDYDIDIPHTVVNNISNSILITVKAALAKLNK